MALRHCIVHQWCVENLRNSPDGKIRTEGRMALTTIAKIRSEFGDRVIDIEDGDPTEAAKQIHPEDTVVVLSGAFRSSCLSGARQALEEKGVRVLFHRYGSVPYNETEDIDLYEEEPPDETDSDIPFDGWVTIPPTHADSPHRTKQE